MARFYAFRRFEVAGLAAPILDAVASGELVRWHAAFDLLRSYPQPEDGYSSADEITVESFDRTAILVPGEIPSLPVLHTALREFAMVRQLYHRDTDEDRPSTHYSIAGQQELAELVAESEAWDFLMGGVFNTLGMPGDIRFMDGQRYATTSWQDAEAMGVLLRDEGRERILPRLESHPAGVGVARDYALVLELFGAALTAGHELYYQEHGT